MPFAPGNPKPPGSGRKKGSLARPTAARPPASKPLASIVKTTLTLREVAVRLAELDCDPIEGMARLAADPNSDPALKGRMYAELAQYVWPKRRAVEHSGPGGTALDSNVSARDVLAGRIAGLAARLLAAGDHPKPQ